MYAIREAAGRPTGSFKTLWDAEHAAATAAEQGQAVVDKVTRRPWAVEVSVVDAETWRVLSVWDARGRIR